MGKAKILIADDDPDIRESLQAILEGQQYTVVTSVARLNDAWDGTRYYEKSYTKTHVFVKRTQ